MAATVSPAALNATYRTLASAPDAPVPAREIAAALGASSLEVVEAARAARSRDARIIVRAIPGSGITIALPSVREL